MTGMVLPGLVVPGVAARAPWTATHTIPAVVSYAVVAAALLGVLGYVRTLLKARRRAERIVAELQATRRAAARAAALAERARLAREMHDILAHVLSALALQLEGTQLLLEREGASPRARRQVARAQRLAHDGLDEARRAIGALRGDALPGPELLPRLVEDFEHSAGVPSRLVTEGEPRPLTREASLAVYRTAQEALTNTRRHAHPERVDVLLRYEPDAVVLVVEDHGHRNGSVPLVPSGGHGLVGIRERAELLDGELAAGPSGDGFRVRLRLPV